MVWYVLGGLWVLAGVVWVNLMLDHKYGEIFAAFTVGVFGYIWYHFGLPYAMGLFPFVALVVMIVCDSCPVKHGSWTDKEHERWRKEYVCNDSWAHAEEFNAWKKVM